MPRYFIQARCAAEGIQGLASDSASGRRAGVQAAVKTLAGRLRRSPVHLAAVMPS